MKESSVDGKGRGKTRWMVTGGEGSEVARHQLYIHQRPYELTFVQDSINHFTLYIAPI